MGSLGDSLLSQPILSPLTSLVLEQCWASIPIDTLLPPLAEIPTYADYMAAFAVRNNFAELFESHPPHPPFFNPVFDQHTRRQRDHYYRFLEQLGKIHEQNKGQALSLAACNGSPVPSQRPKYINSLVGDPGSQRPFCKLLAYPEVNATIVSCLSSVVRSMVRGCRTPERSNGIVYLGTKPEVWAKLDPLRRAQVVLAARSWMMEMGAEAAAKKRGQPPPQAQRSIMSLAHYPLLTARQSRRSGVSALELQRRWAGVDPAWGQDAAGDW